MHGTELFDLILDVIQPLAVTRLSTFLRKNAGQGRNLVERLLVLPTLDLLVVLNLDALQLMELGSWMLGPWYMYCNDPRYDTLRLHLLQAVCSFEQKIDFNTSHCTSCNVVDLARQR